MALGVGGLAQLLAGMWEFASGNTFGATGELHLPARSQLHFPRIQTRATICRSGRSSPSQRGSAGVTPLLDAASSLIYFALSPVNFYPSAGPFIRVLQYLADALSLSLAAFTSYGGFWLSFATLYIPGSGILAAYDGKTAELESALGVYLITWFVVTFLLL